MDLSLLDQLKYTNIVKEISYFDEIDSTNKRAKEDVLSDDKIALPHLYISDIQTAGRGRLGRSWVSPAGFGIWMSYLFRPELSPELISGVTLLASIAVHDGIRKYAEISSFSLNSMDLLKIKWPNDIVLNSKKICGILTELIAPNYVICGIGINVNTPSFSDDIKDKATSLMLETGEKWNREQLITLIIENLDRLIKEYEKEKTLTFIQEKYNNLLVSMNKEVILNTFSADDESNKPSSIEKNQDLSASFQNHPTYISRGIDSTGALLVEDFKGTITTVSSGEVSVRGLYGYV